MNGNWNNVNEIKATGIVVSGRQGSRNVRRQETVVVLKCNRLCFDSKKAVRKRLKNIGGSANITELASGKLPMTTALQYLREFLRLHSTAVILKSVIFFHLLSPTRAEVLRSRAQGPKLICSKRQEALAMIGLVRCLLPRSDKLGDEGCYLREQK